MAKIKHALYSEIVPSISGTHAAILALKNSSTLVPGGLYKITDFQTVHTIPNSVSLNVNGQVYVTANLWDKTLWEGVEELIITAANINSFAPRAISPTFPSDIIEFDFNDILCEDGITARKGKITYRKDTINNIETYYDWRKVIFRRWKINPATWVAGTSYNRSQAIKGSDGSTYISKRSGNIGNDPIASPYTGNPANNNGATINSIWWEKVVLGTKSQYLSYNSIQVGIGSAIVPAGSEYLDYHTFNTTSIGDKKLIKNIKIGKHSTYNNIIFINTAINWSAQPDNNETVYNNEFADGCYEFTIQGWFNNNNKFGLNCSNHIIQGAFHNNEFASSCSNNIYAYCDYQTNGGVEWNKFAGGFSNNTTSGQFQYNTFLAASFLSGNFFGYNFIRNLISGHFYFASINRDCADNVIQFMNNCNLGDYFQHNLVYGGAVNDNAARLSTIGNNCKFNLIRSMVSCFIGNDFQYNVIETGIFKGITILDTFQYNRFYGTVAAGTSFAVGCTHNVFNNVFSGGTVAIPLKLIDCVFNKPVQALQVESTAIVLTKVQSDVSIIDKRFPTSLTEIVISHMHIGGGLWSSTIDSSGVITTFLIV